MQTLIAKAEASLSAADRMQIAHANPMVKPDRSRAERSGAGELESACQEMESLFIQYLMKEMRATIPRSGFFGDSWAEQIYTSMLDSQLSREMAGRGGIGLTNLLKAQLMKSFRAE